jgi:predicted transcriptional regulator YdeE
MKAGAGKLKQLTQKNKFTWTIFSNQRISLNMDSYSHPAFEITGYKITTNAQHVYKDIDAAWKVITENKIFEHLRGKAFEGVHSVYFNYTNQSDPEQHGYDVLIGFITDAGTVQTDYRLTTLTIPAQDYQYMTVTGTLPKDLIAQWHIVNAMPASELHRSFGYDMDMYSADGKSCTLTVSVVK